MYQITRGSSKVCEVARRCVGLGGACVLLLLEMLVGAELTEQREENVQRLDDCFIIAVLVHWHIYEGANQTRVVLDIHLNLWSWESDLLEGCFHFWIPLLHQSVVVGHVLGVIDCRRGSCLMQILHTANPARNFLRLFVRVFNGVHIDWGCSHDVLTLHVLQFQHSLVLVVKSWLIKNCDTQVLLRAIGFGHLKEGIDFSNSRDVLGNEWLDLGLEVYLLRLVTLDVLKEFFDLIRNGQVCIRGWIVSSWDFLLILIVLIIFGWLLRLGHFLHLLHLSWLLGLLLSSSC